MKDPLAVMNAVTVALSLQNGAAPIERDRDDADELADKCEDLGMKLAEREGRYTDATILQDAAYSLRELIDQREMSRDTVARLLDEIHELRMQVPRYRQDFHSREQPGEYVREPEQDDGNDWEGP